MIENILLILTKLHIIEDNCLKEFNILNIIFENG